MPAPTGVAFPARCAIAVVCGQHLVSQVYPASVPVEVFIDDVVELLSDELKRRGLTGLDSDVGYDLHKANGVRLDISRTLDESGVEDGDTLVLMPAAIGDSFEPQYESLSTGLARAGQRLFDSVTAATAAHTALVIVAMAGTVILGLGIRMRVAADSPIPSIVTGAVGLLAGGAALAVRRWWPQHPDLVGGFGWLAVPALAVSLGAAPPGAVGAPHVFITTLAAVLLICGLVVLTGRLIGTATAAVTLCVLGAAVAAIRMWLAVPAQWLGMGTMVALLVLLTTAPVIALRVAGIRPPHFGSITGRDLFRRSDGLPADAVAPVDAEAEVTGEEAESDTTPRGEHIARMAIRANAVLTGICVGAGLALPPAAWCTLTRGQRHGTAAAVLVGLFVVIYISRGRAFADKRQAVALVAGAAATVCAGVAAYVLHEPPGSGAGLLRGALALGGFAAAALVAGLLVPATRFTPLVRMVAEWLELAAIVAALPLAAWIGGLFTWVRMR